MKNIFKALATKAFHKKIEVDKGTPNTVERYTIIPTANNMYAVRDMQGVPTSVGYTISHGQAYYLKRQFEELDQLKTLIASMLTYNPNDATFTYNHPDANAAVAHLSTIDIYKLQRIICTGAV